MSLRVLIVEARFYEAIADALLAGATATLQAHGATVEAISVPGALEIPAAIAMAHRAGGFDGYVALGCVIRGETYHFEIVANECARGLADLAMRRRLAIGSGVLTVEDEAQAWARAAPDAGDKGGAAARACLAMIGVKDRFAGVDS